MDVMRGLEGVEQLERRVQLAGGCWGPSTEKHHQGYRGMWAHLEWTEHALPGSWPLPSSLHAPSFSLLPAP